MARRGLRILFLYILRGTFAVRVHAFAVYMRVRRASALLATSFFITLTRRSSNSSHSHDSVVEINYNCRFSLRRCTSLEKDKSNGSLIVGVRVRVPM